MMRVFKFMLAFFMTIVSCSNIDQYTDKKKLSPNDYRLYQGTIVWPLARAAHNGNLELIKNILANNPKLANVKDSIFGNTMLMMSVMNQDLDLFNALIDNGAIVNYHNTFGGETPLIEACSYKQYDSNFAKKLVENGADINDTTCSTNIHISPLMAAAKCGNTSIAKYLIERGANINYRNNFGSTALGEAMLTQKYDIVLLLLAHGADFTSPIYNGLDEYGKSTLPVYLLDALRDAMIEIGTAQYNEKRMIIKFLKSRGFDYNTVPIPNYVIKRAKDIYPSTWQDYLRMY